MAADFSWRRAANDYMDIYHWLHPEIIRVQQEKRQVDSLRARHVTSETRSTELHSAPPSWAAPSRWASTSGTSDVTCLHAAGVDRRPWASSFIEMRGASAGDHAALLGATISLRETGVVWYSFDIERAPTAPALRARAGPSDRPARALFAYGRRRPSFQLTVFDAARDAARLVQEGHRLPGVPRPLCARGGLARAVPRPLLRPTATAPSACSSRTGTPPPTHTRKSATDLGHPRAGTSTAAPSRASERSSATSRAWA